jgi:hypothetical protein
MIPISVLFAKAESDAVFLFYSFVSECKVLQIDNATSQVLYVGEFDNESQAIKSINEPLVEKRRVISVIGILCSYQSSLLLVATKVRPITLPGGHKVIAGTFFFSLFFFPSPFFLCFFSSSFPFSLQLGVCGGAVRLYRHSSFVEE